MTNAKIIEKTKEIVSTIFGYLGVEAEVKVEITEDKGRKIVKIDATGENNLGRLIGFHGKNLEALQLIIQILLVKNCEESVTVALDVNGYREKRELSLKNLAYRIAEQVKKTGKPYELPPLPPAERRIIHITLSEDKDVKTESTGEGEARRVVIKPVNSA
uniref:KH domain-containing protein n=1 Tax=candidate division CPR3 bacterium TaxID=2268181 RepID=A0A7C5YX46_UNCC3